jgi:hypothetical protein
MELMIYFVALLGILLYTFYYSWIVSYLWGWFITPVFGIETPSVFYILGLFLMIGMLKDKKFKEIFKKSDSTPKENIKSIIANLLYPIFVLGIGWILHSIIGH